MPDLPIIGVIAAGVAGPITGLKAGLTELGLLEGQNIRLELRVANGDLSKLPAFAAELVGRNVKLIAAIGAVTARALQKATSVLPVIYCVVVDPVGDGLNASLDKPGGNMTGITTFHPDQAQTNVQLLRSIAPAALCIAVLSDAGVSDCLVLANVQAIEAAGLRPLVLRIAGPQADLDLAFTTLDRAQAGGLIVLEHPINAVCGSRIAELAVARGLPTVFARDQSHPGGLFSYGTSLRRAAHQMANYARRVLDGCRPENLPVETFVRPELVVSLQTARKLGVVVPPEILNDRAIACAARCAEGEPTWPRKTWRPRIAASCGERRHD